MARIYYCSPLISTMCFFVSSASVMYDLVSEDQMRSAFEIADTNGDGVLTYTEAIEVSMNNGPSLFIGCSNVLNLYFPL